MVFKLVRIDIENPHKIQLPTGIQILGRGQVLDCDDKRVSRRHGELVVSDDDVLLKACDDKRVSRRHGELVVSDDDVLLKALHQNPLFYTKKGIDEKHILKRDSTVNLSHGDRFGFLPDSHWYELLHCTGWDANSPERIDSNNTEPLEQTIAATETETQVIKNGHDPIDDELPNCDLSQPLNSSQRCESPSLLPPPDVAGSPTLTPKNENQEPSDTERTVENQSPTNIQPAEHGQSPVKRSHSPAGNEDEVKRIKVEPEVKQEPDTQPGPSGDQGSSSADGAPPSPHKPPPAPARERCMYGANCYRKNPMHKSQFSHPSDADWGGGARGVCPYGRGCRRRDPRHWRDHDHPPGAAPPPHHPHPPANRPGMQVVERHGNIFYINAHSVNFYDEHFQVEDSDGDSVDYDYEF